MKKWQLIAVVVGLLVVFAAMNTIMDYQRQQTLKDRKEAEVVKLGAETKAGAGGSHGHGGPGGKLSFALPKPSGPPAAPVKIEAFLGSTCKGPGNDLPELSKTYGKLVRVVWLDLTKPEVAIKADKLALGCEAGLSVNGKVEWKLPTPQGKRVIAFRGPVNSEKYRVADVYLAVNTILQGKGLKVPAEAKKRAEGGGLLTPAQGGAGMPPHEPLVSPTTK